MMIETVFVDCICLKETSEAELKNLTASDISGQKKEADI